MTNQSVQIEYFTDVLCVWAYLSEAKLHEIRNTFGSQCKLICRSVGVFGDTTSKLVEGWSERGGVTAYADHVQAVVEDFGYEAISTKAWRDTVPRSSLPAHLYIAAVRNVCARAEEREGPRSEWKGRSTVEEFIWRVRCAFFRDGLDIATTETLDRLVSELNLPIDEVRADLDCGRAHAAMFADQSAADQQGVSGSPTFVLNDGRQMLYGNVGYRVIEANIRELLDRPDAAASWC